PHHLAHRLMDAGGAARSLENLTPFHLVRRPDAEGDDEGEMAADDHGFLGVEFLTWLWFKSQSQNSKLALRGDQNALVALEKSTRLVCDFGLTGTTVVTRDAPGTAPESRAAVAIGKQPTKLGLIVGGAAGEFRLTLDGARMAVSGLVLPEDVEDKPERDAT